MDTGAPPPPPARKTAPPKLRAAIAGALREAGGPLTLDDLVRRLQESVGTLPRGRERIRAAMGKENPLVTRVGTLTFDLTERRLREAAFRHRLTAAEVRHGTLLAAPELPYVYDWDGARGSWQGPAGFVTGDGRDVPATLAHILGSADPARAVEGVLGMRRYAVIRGLSPFLEGARAVAGDDLLIRVADPFGRTFQVSVERPGTAGAERADEALADLAEAALCRGKGSDFPRGLMHCLVGLDDFRRPPAPHLPIFALARHPRVHYDGTTYWVAGAGQPYATDLWARETEFGPGTGAEAGAAVDPFAALSDMLRLEFPSLPPEYVRGVMERQLGVAGVALLGETMTRDRDLLRELLADRQALLSPTLAGSRRRRRGTARRPPRRP